MLEIDPTSEQSTSTHMNNITSFTLAALLLAPPASVVAEPQLPAADGALRPAVTITLDAKDKGREFEGVGAVSAGASTRNLIDYPARQRSEVFSARDGGGGDQVDGRLADDRSHVVAQAGQSQVGEKI